MSLKSGFFNSRYNDRRLYEAPDMANMFEGVVEEGVLMSYGGRFFVKAQENNVLTIAPGRAWWNSHWIVNDSPITILVADQVTEETYDAIIFDISEENREVVPLIEYEVDPENPTFTSNQMPIAYVHRFAGEESITQSNVIQLVGSSLCPYVIGIMSSLTNDAVKASFADIFEPWFLNLRTNLDSNQLENLTSQLNLIRAELEGRNDN